MPFPKKPTSVEREINGAQIRVLSMSAETALDFLQEIAPIAGALMAIWQGKIVELPAGALQKIKRRAFAAVEIDGHAATTSKGAELLADASLQDIAAILLFCLEVQRDPLGALKRGDELAAKAKAKLEALLDGVLTTSPSPSAATGSSGASSPPSG